MKRAFLVLSAFALGCGSPDGGSVQGSSDAGAPTREDAGGRGAGSDAAPRGESDAATAQDSGMPRADVPAVSCSDALADVYLAPPTLPPMTASSRGDIVRCAKDKALARAAVESTVSGKGIDVTATSGTTLYRVAYRTERADGSPALSSARVYLPDTPRALPLPVIVVAHPTVGLAASCTPSMDDASLQDLALPWASRGYAVIAPDYAGLGTAGVQGYLDNRDTGKSTLDAARALRKVLSPGALSPSVLISGFSQGGGAALSAQALEKSYGAGGHLVAVIAFAPQWQTRLNSFGYVSLLRRPDDLTIFTGVTKPVVAVLRQYAYFANYVGAANAGDGFPAANRSAIAQQVTSLCQTPLGGYLQGTAPRIHDLVDETLRTSLLACIDAGGVDCTEPGKSYYAFLNANVLRADPAGASVLFVQGLADLILPPAEEAACNIAKLEADGLSPTVCTDQTAQHTTVVARNMAFALSWGEAKLEGRTEPSCASSGMPQCTP